MRIISEEQFKKKYGEEFLENFAPQIAKEPSYLERVGAGLKETFTGLQEDIKTQQHEFAKPLATGGAPVKQAEAAVRGGLRTVGALAQAAFVPVMEAPGIKQGTEFIGEQLAKTTPMQTYMEWTQRHPEAAKDIENVLDIASVAPALKGVSAATKSVAGGTKVVGQGVKTGLKKGVKVAKPLGGATKDIVPTSERLISSNVTKALDLTPGDVKNILLSTGNDVGGFMAQHNLIGSSLQTTRGLLDDFFKKNYKGVRSEIANVKTPYNPASIPRYTETLKSLYEKTAKVPGLEESAKEIRTLLSKKSVTLSDVQRAKELIDKHSNLYKVTGDVMEGLEKQGLANIRKDLRAFIEQEVKKNTGSDIRALNNQVQTSREILDAMKARSTRGLTRYNLTLRDVGLFAGGTVTGSPLFGAALVFIKKLAESPSIRLKIAKLVDAMSDARKAKVEAQLRAGQVPKEFQSVK